MQYANSFAQSANGVESNNASTKRKKIRTSHKGSPYLFGRSVEIRLQASSTRTAIFSFFDYQTLHIARIFGKIVSFCTPVPFIPYRIFPVVVSYVVNPKMMIKIGAAGAFGKPTLLLIN